MLRKKDSYRKEADYICVSQSTLDSIETNQDDKAKINLTRLESWQEVSRMNDITINELQFLHQIEWKSLI